MSLEGLCQQGRGYSVDERDNKQCDRGITSCRSRDNIN